MNGIARRFLGGGLGGGSKDPTPAPAAEPPTVAPLAIGGSKSSQSGGPTRSLTGRSDDMQSPISPAARTWTGSTDGGGGIGGGVVDQSTVRQRPARTSSKSSAAAVLSPPPQPQPQLLPLARAGPSSRPVVNTKSAGSTNGTVVVGAVNTPDELLLSLLASEAVVDSREAEILSAEQVEELKKARIRFFTNTLAFAK